jgi:hypothetical protein
MSTQSNLENAASGLMMMSESDYPFEYISADQAIIDEALILKLAGKSEGTPVTTTTIEYLLRNMTNPASGSVNAETAMQFQNLSGALQQELTELTVYRVGEIQVVVLILGITAEETVAGLRTKLIET